MAKRQRKTSRPRLADLIAEIRELRSSQLAMRAELDEHARTLKIQFQRIAQLQADVDKARLSREQLKAMMQLRRGAGSRSPSA